MVQADLASKKDEPYLSSKFIDIFNFPVTKKEECKYSAVITESFDMFMTIVYK